MHQSPVAKDLVHPARVVKPPLKAPEKGFGAFRGGDHVEGRGAGMPGGGAEVCISSVWLSLSYVLL